MSNAISGVGIKFYRADHDSSGDSSGNWERIAEIKSIGGPNMTRKMITVTNLDSDGGYEEYIPHFRDAGELTLGMNFTLATYQTLKDDFESGDVVHYRVAFPNETINFYYEGYVSALGRTVDTDNAVTADVTIKITGQEEIES